MGLTDASRVMQAHPGGGISAPRREWLIVCLLAVLAGIILFASFFGGRPYPALTTVIAVPVGIWLVWARPIWAILLYISICGSPLFGIHDYIEPGEFAAGGLLILLLLREGLRGGLAESLGKLSKPYLALVFVFCVSVVMALAFHNSVTAWAREQAQYLPLFFGPIVARNLRTRREVLAIVLVSAATAVIALPFEAYQFLLAREGSFILLTGEQFRGAERLPLPHFSVLNAGTFAALLGSWLLIRKPRPWRLFNYVLAALVPVAMFLAQTRIWTAVAILALLLPLFLRARRARLLSLTAKAALVFLLALMTLFGAYKGLEATNPDLADLLAARLLPLQSASQDQSVEIRWEGAKYLVSIVAESPLIGHGLGYEVPLAPWEWARLTRSVSAFDNAHLALFIKFGFLGAAVFYWLFWKLARQAYFAMQTSHQSLDTVVSSTFLVGLICLLLVGLSYSALNVFENTNFLGIWSGMLIFLRQGAGNLQSK